MKKKNIFVIIVLSFVLVINVGFSLFSETVTVNGTSNASGNFDVAFTTLTRTAYDIYPVKEVGSTGAHGTLTKEGKEIEIVVPALEYPGAYAEFHINIVNSGDIPIRLKNIGDMVGNVTNGEIKTSNPDIKVNVSGLTDKILNKGDIQQFSLMVSWNVSSVKTANNVNFTIKLNYEQVVSDEKPITPDTPVPEENITPPKPTYPEPPRAYVVGDRFCLNGSLECFRVIKDNGATITAFADKSISLDSVPKQTNAVVDLAFSSKPYWMNTKLQLKPEYGASYNADVYPVKNGDESFSNILPVLNRYKNYLGTLGYNRLDIRIITHNDLESLGCKGYSCTGSFYKSFIINGNGYWTGTAYDGRGIWTVGSSGTFKRNDYDFAKFGIRPVIEVLKQDIKKLDIVPFQG